MFSTKIYLFTETPTVEPAPTCVTSTTDSAPTHPSTPLAEGSSFDDYYRHEIIDQKLTAITTRKLMKLFLARNNIKCDDCFKDALKDPEIVCVSRVLAVTILLILCVLLLLVCVLLIVMRTIVNLLHDFRVGWAYFASTVLPLLNEELLKCLDRFSILTPILYFVSKHGIHGSATKRSLIALICKKLLICCGCRKTEQRIKMRKRLEENVRNNEITRKNEIIDLINRTSMTNDNYNESLLLAQQPTVHKETLAQPESILPAVLDNVSTAAAPTATDSLDDQPPAPLDSLANAEEIRTLPLPPSPNPTYDKLEYDDSEVPTKPNKIRCKCCRCCGLWPFNKNSEQGKAELTDFRSTKSTNL